MKWEQMTWTDKFNAVVDVFGTAVSDCGAEELMHLWDEIQARDLQFPYIMELATVLRIIPGVNGYTPAQILQMMTASDEDHHWPAALKAAERWEY